MSVLYNTVTVNGEAFNCFNSMSLYDLILYLNFDLNTIIVEYNQEIIPNHKFDNLILKHQDKLEIITIVGGG
uniref:Thiamine biosynthesis protein n=1 Tax=Catenella fusiformis TaxID=3024791 RepID=UPI0027DAA886|nr:Thiamine biosynthesis protein [Catenella fusiformis]WCH57612.1 Thiamine biosynthesis protein [Catenella fusiformis]